MKTLIKIFLVVFILNSCSSAYVERNVFVANNTSDSITISFDAYFVREKTKNDFSRQQIQLVPVSTDIDFDSDSLYFVQARDIQNPTLLPYVLCEWEKKRTAADTGNWISAYKSDVNIVAKIENMIGNCVSLDTINDSTAHLRLKIPSRQNFQLGRIGFKGLSDNYFKNFTVGYKDAKDRTLQLKFYENYGQLKKDFRLFGEKDSALVIE